MKLLSLVITGLVLVLLISLSVMTSEVTEKILQNTVANEEAPRQHKHIAAKFLCPSEACSPRCGKGYHCMKGQSPKEPPCYCMLDSDMP